MKFVFPNAEIAAAPNRLPHHQTTQSPMKSFVSNEYPTLGVEEEFHLVDPSTGARPLRRTIQRHVQDAVSEVLISRHGEKTELIHVSIEEGSLAFQPREPAAVVEEA